MTNRIYLFQERSGRWTGFSTHLFPLAHPWLGRATGDFFKLTYPLERVRSEFLGKLDPNLWCDPADLGITFPDQTSFQILKGEDDGNG